MSCLLWPREAASGQKLNGRSRKRSHQSIGPGLQTNASWWSQYQVLSVHFVLLFWLCCMCSLGSFKWKRGTITVFQHAWNHYIAWPHDYIIHISTWTLCRASRAVSISGIHHHGTAVQNAIWAVQPQLRWSPALHNETRKMKKKIEKVEKVSLFFHESWCIIPSPSLYHAIMTFTCIQADLAMACVSSMVAGYLYIWVADFRSPLEPSKVGPVGLQNPVFLFLLQTRHSCGPRCKLAWSHFEKTGEFKIHWSCGIQSLAVWKTVEAFSTTPSWP